MKKEDVLVETYQCFADDESHLSKNDKEMVSKGINNLIEQLRTNSWSKYLYRNKNVKFPKGMNKKNSSLYLYKVENTLNRIILAVDKDIVFKQRIISLFRVVSKEKSTEAFNHTAQLLYS